MSNQRNDRIGQQVGNYCLLRILGYGGFADVYLGEHLYLKTQAAIKILRTPVTEGDCEEVLKEARTIARLEHPNIVRMLECGMVDDHLFQVMTYAPSGTLRQRHARGARLPFPLLITYIRQIASALQYAHAHRLIHRDVKPENMLLGQQDRVVLSDFGLVMIAHSSRSQVTATMAGTLAYMAPEQIQGKPRFASDQYALAIVIYEWLCGARPFNGSFVEVASQQLMAPPPSLCDRLPGLPREVEQVVFKALAKQPAERFEHIEMFAQALIDVLTASISGGVRLEASRSADHGLYQTQLCIETGDGLAMNTGDDSATVLKQFQFAPIVASPGISASPLPHVSQGVSQRLATGQPSGALLSHHSDHAVFSDVISNVAQPLSRPGTLSAEPVLSSLKHLQQGEIVPAHLPHQDKRRQGRGWLLISLSMLTLVLGGCVVLLISPGWTWIIPHGPNNIQGSENSISNDSNPASNGTVFPEDDPHHSDSDGNGHATNVVSPTPGTKMVPTTRPISNPDNSGATPQPVVTPPQPVPTPDPPDPEPTPEPTPIPTAEPTQGPAPTTPEPVDPTAVPPTS